MVYCVCCVLVCLCVQINANAQSDSSSEQPTESKFEFKLGKKTIKILTGSSASEPDSECEEEYILGVTDADKPAFKVEADRLHAEKMAAEAKLKEEQRNKYQDVVKTFDPATHPDAQKAKFNNNPQD